MRALRRRSFLQAAVGLAVALPACAPAEERQVRRLRFVWELLNPADQWLGDERFACALPATVEQGQQLIDAQASHPLSWNRDCLGQNTAVITLAEVAPRQRVRVALDARVALAPAGASGTGMGCERWIGAAPFLELDAPPLRELAAALRQSDDGATAQAIFGWIVDNIQYSGYSPNDKGALHALTMRRGDCTEFAHLATALARAAGLPARTAGGYVMDHDAIVQPGDYHDWAELWVGQRWLILDAQRRVFDPGAGSYLPFRFYSDKGEGALAAHHRWRALGQLRVV